MQVKPRFQSYKILEEFYLLTDDTGNKFNLVLIEVKLPDSIDEIVETTYKFWTVIGNNKQITWSNKAVSYEDVCYYKDKVKANLFKEIINGFNIEEVVSGFHHVFVTDNIKEQEGLRTTFTIKRI